MRRIICTFAQESCQSEIHAFYDDDDRDETDTYGGL